MSQFTKNKKSRIAKQRMLDKAYTALEFNGQDKPSNAQVMERYTMMVKAIHPDSSEDAEGWVPTESLDVLRNAKDLILNSPHRR